MHKLRIGIGLLLIAALALIASNLSPAAAHPGNQAVDVQVDVETVRKDVTIDGVSVGQPDHDSDDLNNFSEAILGTDPFNPDSDGDGFRDNQEVQAGTDPLDPTSAPPADSDGDRLSDVVEGVLGTDPNNRDTDGDGADDGDEFFGGADPNDPNSTPPPGGDTSGDSDGDGLTDAQELQLGTNPNNRHSDADGFDDGYEISVGTNPLLAASAPPADSDGDGLSDVVEALLGTDPNEWDSDEDNFADHEEIDCGSNPQDADSVPPPTPQVLAGQNVLVEVQEEIHLDAVTNPPDFGPVAVTVSEEFYGQPDCTLSFHVTPEFEDLVTELRFWCFQAGVDLSPADGVVVAPQGGELSIGFTIELSPGQSVILDELWGFACDNPGHHQFTFKKQVNLHPSYPNIFDRNQDNNDLRVKFEVALIGEVDVEMVRKDVTIDGVPVGQPDHDDDGLNNFSEVLLGTDPFNPDSDGDGFRDGNEVEAGTNPLHTASTPPVDSDNDGVSDVLEALLGTDPFNPDSDGDGFDDGHEFSRGSDPTNFDTDLPPQDTSGDNDGDGLSNSRESLLGTDPFNPDSDGDGFRDGHEVQAGTDPLEPTSAPPLDSDEDGLSDQVEGLLGSDSNNRDTDGDGPDDGHEFSRGSDLLDPNSVPPPIVEVSVGQHVLINVEEEIRLDPVTNPPGLGPVSVGVREDVNPGPGGSLSFHVTQAFLDAGVRGLRFATREERPGVPDVELFPDAMGVVAAPPGQHLVIEFDIDLTPGQSITLDEQWGFTCDNPRSSGLGIVTFVNPLDQYIVDRNEVNSVLHMDLPVEFIFEEEFRGPEGPEVDLGVTMSESPDPVIAGNNLTYTVTAINNGPSDATGVTVTDRLPAGTTFVFGASSLGCYESKVGTVTCAVGDLGNGASSSFNIVVAVDPATADGTVLANTVNVSGDVTDPDSANNSATAETTVIRVANLSVTTSDSPDPVTAGTNLTYTVTVTNHGPLDATGVMLTDSLPTGTSFVSGSSSAGCLESAPGTVTCDLGDLANGASATVTIVVAVHPSAAEGVILANTATASGNERDLDSTNDSDTEETTVVRVADLSVTKSPSPDPVIAGTNLTYTVTVTNNGPSDATGVTLTDSLPAEATFVSGLSSVGCLELAPGIVTCDLGDLANGASSTVTIVFSVDPSAAEGLILANTATAGGNEADPDSDNDSDSGETTVTRVADVLVTKTGSPDPVIAGNVLTYVLAVINAGPSDATGVLVLDELPAGVTFVSATPGRGTFNSETGEWAVGDLPRGIGAPLIIKVNVDSSTRGTIDSTASVTATEDDPDENNNSAVEVSQVEAQADLSVSMEDDPDGVITGNELTYTVTVTNNGPSDATGVTLIDTLPAGVAFVSATPGAPTCTESNGIVTCTLGDLANGASSTVTILVTVLVDLSETQSITNTASVEGTETDPIPANDSTTEDTRVFADVDTDGVGDLVEDGAPNEGDGNNDGIPDSAQADVASIPNSVDGQYVTIDAADDNPLSAVEATDNPAPADAPPNVDFPLGFIDFAVGVPLPGGSTTVEIFLPPGTVVVTYWKYGPTPNTPTPHWYEFLFDGTTGAEINGNVITLHLVDGLRGDGDLMANGVIVDPGAPQILTADLSLTKTNSLDVVIAGNVLTYTVTVTNNGPLDATGVTVTDALPAGVTFISATPGAPTCTESNGIVTCDVGDLANGASSTVTIEVAVDSSTTGTISNTASVAGNEPDDNMDNTATEDIAVDTLTDLSVTQTAAPTSVLAGDSITYSLTVTNNGPSDATGVVLSDTLPLVGVPGLTLVSATASQGTCTEAGGTITCSLGTVPSGAEVDVTIVVNVSLSVPNGTVLTSTATVAGNENDPDSDNNSDTAETTVILMADLSVTKSDSSDPVIAGTNLTYTVGVTNAGPSIATGVTLIDTLPAGVTFVSATASQGSCSTSGGIVTCTLGDLDSGTSATVTIVVMPTTAGTLSNTASVTGNEPDPDPVNNTATAQTTVNARPLDHVVVTPSSASLDIGATQQFSAAAYDGYDDVIPGLTFTWSVEAGGGTVDSSGLFIAGTVAGTFTDTVKGETTQGAIISSDTGTVTVNPGPLDHVVVTPSSVTLDIGGTQRFSATPYDQYNNEIPGLSFTWSVDAGGGDIDGSGLFSAGTAAGTFAHTVKAQATQGSITRSDTATVTISCPAPEAGFSAEPTSGTAPLDVKFSDKSTGSITSWSWDFGDGGTSTGQNPSHTYTAAGAYTVSLTVRGPGGSDTEIKTGYITVYEPTPTPTPKPSGFGCSAPSGGATGSINGGAVLLFAMPLALGALNYFRKRRQS